jgi:hypothetical protein
MYANRINVLTIAIASASLSDSPCLGPRALAQKRHILFIYSKSINRPLQLYLQALIFDSKAYGKLLLAR